MPKDLAVKLEGVGLDFPVVPRQSETSIRDPRTFLHRRRARRTALDGISLEVEKGSRLALLGRNGAGKTTLLKVISGILPVKRGTCLVRGRVHAVLSIGGGFNPRLSGTDNAILAGLARGHSKDFLLHAIPSIQDFTELGDRIHEPLASYSTGMVSRLGFAVATLGDPEILVLDETLSVGDSHFQSKAKARMNELMRGSSTLLLVSHQRSLVEDLCDRTVLLDAGRVVADGLVEETYRVYEGLG